MDHTDYRAFIEMNGQLQLKRKKLPLYGCDDIILCSYYHSAFYNKMNLMFLSMVATFVTLSKLLYSVCMS